MTPSPCRTWAVLCVVTLVTLFGSNPGGPFAADEPSTPTDRPSSGADTPSSPVPSSNPMSGKADAIEAGRKLFFTWCVQCHGPKADGVSRFGQYAADLRKFWRGYREFIILVKNGRPERQMPPWKEVLDEAKISEIGAFLETLAVEDANWR